MLSNWRKNVKHYVISDFFGFFFPFLFPFPFRFGFRFLKIDDVHGLSSLSRVHPEDLELWAWRQCSGIARETEDGYLLISTELGSEGYQWISIERKRLRERKREKSHNATPPEGLLKLQGLEANPNIKSQLFPSFYHPKLIVIPQRPLFLECHRKTPSQA